MLKTLALTALAATTIAMVSCPMQASAETCRKDGQNGAITARCNWLAQLEKNRKAFKMQQEEAAERSAYQKMKQDREQKATTTEHCYMKNGQLECKPVP
jgi:hypothetical protein